MPFNVLLLPLLGGYVFVACWNRTRFSTARSSGERLIFHSAIAGACFLSLAFLVCRAVAAAAPGAGQAWMRMVPFPYAGTSFLAFVLGCVAWIPLNHTLDRRERCAERVILRWNEFLEVLLADALKRTMHVSVTLKSGKVYIGFITRSFDPTYERKYITILPMSSGYRDAADHGVRITTDYARVYQRMMEEENALLLKGVEDFQVVMPVAEIQSANLFDPRAFQLFRTLQPLAR